jgi:hypothetical protein
MKRGIFGKASLYAVPLFLAPFLDKMADFLLRGEWPTIQMAVYCTIAGIISMCIGLRAFFDGSAERAKQDNFPPLDQREAKTVAGGGSPEADASKTSQPVADPSAPGGKV